MSMLIPRLEIEDLAPALRQALAPRVKRLGYLGEFFKCAGHQPAALLSFMRFTEDLKEALPDNLTEVVALTVAGSMDNAYERHQHERLCRRLGFSPEWIGAVNALDPAAGTPLSEDERLVQRLVVAVIERQGRGVGEKFDAVVRAVGPARSMAVLMLIGRYVTHALIVNTLALAPPVPSIFAEAKA
ncbi:MAG: carboxymuconolactone decarboxylase family protein [Pseudomonadota bacterium]